MLNPRRRIADSVRYELKCVFFLALLMIKW